MKNDINSFKRSSLEEKESDNGIKFHCWIMV